jgi:hypothetical protein
LHGWTGVEKEIVLLGFALWKVGGLNGVVLNVQPSRSQSRMPSYDIGDDWNDLRPLPD